MKLKYYMRGVGTGILFTLFVFLVIIIPNIKLKMKLELSENAETQQTEEVSSLLGSTDSKSTYETAENSAADSLTEPAADKEALNVPETSPSAEPVKEPEVTQAPDVQAEQDSTDTEEPAESVNVPDENQTAETEGAGASTEEDASNQDAEASPTPESRPTSTPVPAEIDEVTGEIKFKITAGMTSEQFSSAMEKLGVVDSWRSLNSYICNNGYAFKIQVGTFKFKKGMTYREVVKAITGK